MKVDIISTMIFNKFQIAVCLSAVSFAAVAAEVEISARGGVIPNNSEAEVSISKTDGTGDQMTLANDQTQVKSLTQRQMAIPAVVYIEGQQKLSLGLARMVENAKSLVLGKEKGEGSLSSVDGAMTWQVDGAQDEMAVNANVRPDPSVPVIEKTGAGRVKVGGDLIATIRHRAGRMVFDNFMDGARMSIEGVAEYDYCSNLELQPTFTGTFDPSAQMLEAETVIRAEAGIIPVASLQVNGGSVVRVEGASIHQPELSSNLDSGLDIAPGCGLVGSNSVGVLSFDGGSYTGNMVVAAGNYLNARGVLRLYNHAELMNVTTTNAVSVLGAGGYANVDIGDAVYTAAGHWQGAQNGQLMLSIEGGTFRHAPAALRPTSFSLGANNSDTVLYVGGLGTFDASAVVGDEIFIPARGASDARQVSVIVQNGEMNLGAHSLHLRGNANTGKTLILVRDGGVLRAAAANGDPQTISNIRGYLAFDGGTFVMSGDKTYPFGSASKEQGEPTSGVYSFGKGLTLEVPEGMTATIPDGGTISAPTGKGIESVEITTDLQNKTFIGPPVIRFAGDAGNGASAICEFDRSTGKVTGIRVTSRGWGYTDPEALLFYGDPTIEVLKLPVKLSDNSTYQGGLTKSGPGTLVIEGTNTYKGATTVVGGILKLAAEDVIKDSCRLAVRGGAIFDVNGMELEFPDFGGDGTGVVSNGTVTITGLQIDFKRVRTEDYYETLNLTNVRFADGAKLKVNNVNESMLTDTTKEYLLYKIIGGVPSNFPALDTSTYLAGLPETWAVVQRGEDEIVLKYIGGSIFIYY